jgi:alpha-ketoglutarate-dependent taurine dioxygenase
MKRAMTGLGVSTADTVPRKLDALVTDARAWSRRDLDRDHWFLPLPRECLEELATIVDHLETHAQPAILLDPADWPLEACRALAARIRGILDRGVGFVLVDRLPLDRFGRNGAEAAYWLLASLVARPVVQKYDGSSLLYEVKDTGRPVGNGVRRDSTPLDIDFHQDNAYNETPPDHVALLCLRTARHGGESFVTSLYSAHNGLLEEDPAALDRLYRPFLFDRQREHAPGDTLVIARPVFAYDRELRTRLNEFLIRAGHDLAGEPLDAAGDRALRALARVLDREAYWQSFNFEPGQIQFVNNRSIGHKRTAFEDDRDPAKGRLLIRLWLRDDGDRSYAGGEGMRPRG